MTLDFVLAAGLAVYWILLFLRIAGRPDPLPGLPPRVDGRADRPSVSVLVAVRNEMDRILIASLESLLAQDYPRFEVIAVDDHSEDGSLSAMRKLAAKHERLTVVDAPPDVRGKREALALAARRAESAWLLFTDADAMMKPDALVRGVDLASHENLDGLSLLPRTLAVSFWEQVALAASGWLSYEGSALRRCNDDRAPVGLAAAGPYFLVRREAYCSISGFESLGQNVLLDVGLAKRLRAKGFRYRYFASGGVVETRMYRSLREIWQGFGKNASVALGSRLHLAFAAALLLAGLVAGPLALLLGMAFARHLTSLALAVGALAAMMEVQKRGGRFLGTNLGTLPLVLSALGALVWAAILVHSAFAARSRKGVFWKGRHLPAHEPPVSTSWIQRNFWEITDECWSAIEARLERGMRTFETGSGRSTGLFERAGCEHTALEHDSGKRAPYASVVVAPLEGSPPWYSWEPTRPYDLVFIDGPPGRIGRSGILRVLPRLIHENTVIVIDDTHRRADCRLAEEIAVRCGMTVEARTKRVFGLARGFSILSPPWSLTPSARHRRASERIEPRARPTAPTP